MDEARIDELVAEALVRRRVEAQLTPPDRWAWTRHPLFLTVVVFVLSTVLGTLLNAAIQRNAEARAAHAARVAQVERIHEADLATLNAITTLMFERASMTDLLRSALDRQMLEDIRARRPLYDAIYQRWQTELPRTRLALKRIGARSGVAEIDVTRFDLEIQTAFAVIDSCLTLRVDLFLDARTNHTYDASPLRCPPLKGTSHVDWLQRETAAVRDRAMGFEADGIRMIEAARAHALAVAECVRLARPGLAVSVIAEVLGRAEDEAARVATCRAAHAAGVSGVPRARPLSVAL